MKSKDPEGAEPSFTTIVNSDLRVHPHRLPRRAVVP